MAVTPHASLRFVAPNCTSCMLCIRACPVWCMDLAAHLEVVRDGGRQRSTLHLDEFRIDYRSCMMCGLCVEVCPFDALHWSAEPPPELYDWTRPDEPVDPVSPGQ